jgi:ABC-type multidrug transport system ATPase subunit
MLKVRQLTVLHPVGQELTDISFTVDNGEAVAVVGSNQGGKSLLGRVIADSGFSHQGEVIVNHLNRSHEKEKTSFHLGYSPAEPELEPYLSGYEQLDFFGALFGLSSAERAKRIVELAKDFDCSSDIYRMIELMGAAERKKISLIGSVIHNPNVVVWDEPTAFLDPAGQRQIAAQLGELKRNKASVVVITNDLALAQQHCDTLIVFESGRIIASGTLAQLKNQSGSKTGSLEEILSQLGNG